MYYKIELLICDRINIDHDCMPSLEDWCAINGVEIKEVLRYDNGEYEEGNNNWTDYKIGNDLIASDFYLGGDRTDYGLHGENIEKHLGGYLDSLFTAIRNKLTGSNKIPYYYYMDDLPDYRCYTINTPISEISKVDNLSQYVQDKLIEEFGALPECYYFMGNFTIGDKEYNSFESREEYDSLIPESTVIVKIEYN